VIADVAFDVPIDHPFSYRVPGDWTLTPGQRVAARLRGVTRVGVVIALRSGTDERLQPLLRPVDPVPLLGSRQLDLVQWIASESLSSVGSTLAALLPPPLGRGSPPTGAISHCPSLAAEGPRRPELLLGVDRERRVLEFVKEANSAVLTLTPDIATAARWAERLGTIDRVVRLDSGAPDVERSAAWRALAYGSVRLAVGTRSALLAPLPPGATVVLIDEHEAAHKPPGPPRIHARDVVLERATRDDLRAIFTSATPSVEMWWRSESGEVVRRTGSAAAWPTMTLADTRAILRREPLTPPLARAIRETLARRRRVFLAVSRLVSALACEECGTVVRCVECAIALAYSRAGAALSCRLCGRRVPLPDLCSECRGRRLSPFGWGAERVEHAVRRRFPRARVARYDPDLARRSRTGAAVDAAPLAEVVIGTKGALSLFAPGSLGLAGFVAPDQLLRLPDFRAGERALAFFWAAAERVRSDGSVIIQTQNPTHYVIRAVAQPDLEGFYTQELKFRAELGYPPFRRLAIVSVRGGSASDLDQGAERIIRALRQSPRLTAYPPAANRSGSRRRIVVKGDADLPHILREGLREVTAPHPRSRGIIDVEVDPVEWQS